MYHEFKKKREVGHDRAVASLRKSRRGSQNLELSVGFLVGCKGQTEHNGKRKEKLDRIGSWLLS